MFTNRSHQLSSGDAQASDFAGPQHWDSCGNVVGPQKGWFGPECQCGRKPGSALRGAHGMGMATMSGSAAL